MPALPATDEAGASTASGLSLDCRLLVGLSDGSLCSRSARLYLEQHSSLVRREDTYTLTHKKRQGYARVFEHEHGERRVPHERTDASQLRRVIGGHGLREREAGSVECVRGIVQSCLQWRTQLGRELRERLLQSSQCPVIPHSELGQLSGQTKIPAHTAQSPAKDRCQRQCHGIRGVHTGTHALLGLGSVFHSHRVGVDKRLEQHRLARRHKRALASCTVYHRTSTSTSTGSSDVVLRG